MIKNKKLFIFRFLLFAGTAISLYFVPWTVVSAWIKPLPDTIEEQLEQTVDYGFAGAIVYVDQKGKEPQFYAAGYHNKERKIPAYPQAYFKIASITKLYVAVCITKLVANGKLSLDGTVAQYFPEMDGKIKNAKEITVRMMVQHRSGIPNYTNIPTFWSNPPDSDDKILELVYNEPASFEPDTDYEYSNTNYLLLGRLIDKYSGKYMMEFAKERIFNRLNLTHTFNGANDVPKDSIMSGYYVGIDKDFKMDNVGPVATAEDVGIFLRALNEGSVFDQGEKEIYSSIYVYNHTGLVPGYQSIAEYHKDLDAVVIQFTNTTDFNGYEWNLSQVGYGRVIDILKKNQ